MSSTGALPTNTAPLVLRVDNDNPLSINNTFVLNKYGKPVPTGTILLTGPNGAVRADTSISSFNVSSLTTSEIFTSSIQAHGIDITVDSETLLITQPRTFDIPNGATSIDFEIIGAAGSSVNNNDQNSGIGGNGAYISGSIDILNNGLVGKTLLLSPGICENGSNNSSSASFISITDAAAANVLLVVAAAGGNGGKSSVTAVYQAEGGGGGGGIFNPFGDLINAGQVASGLSGTTQVGQNIITAGSGGQNPPSSSPYTAPGGVSGQGNGSGATNGYPGLYQQLTSVSGGLGGTIDSYYGGSGGGGYSGGGGGNINSDKTIVSGGGGGSSYYSDLYITLKQSYSGNELLSGIMPAFGRATNKQTYNISNGAIILHINKSPALTTTGDIDCSGNIQCNILKYNILDPPLYVKPNEAWSNFPAEGNVDISNYTLNNIRSLNVSTIFNYNGMQISESQASDVARPSLSAKLEDYEIRAICDNQTGVQDGAGFLQLTAGGIPAVMSYIQLSASTTNNSVSTIDMNQNIVLGTSGEEQVRINNTGITSQKNVYFFAGKSYIATNESSDGTTYDGTYIEMTQDRPLKVTNGITGTNTTDRQYAYFSTVNSNVSNNFQVYSATTAPNSLNYFSTGATVNNITIDINTNNGDYGSIEAFQTSAINSSGKKPLILNGYDSNNNVNGGYVGINTTNPLAQLHVNGTLSTNNTLAVASGGANIIGNTFIKPDVPTSFDAFKVELGGTNFLVYKDGSTNTVLNNGSGSANNLVLSTGNTVIVNNNTDINGSLTVTSGGANIFGNTNIQPNIPTATDAFKVELDGTNFLVYKDGTTNTVLNNTGGASCNLVLSTSNTVIVNKNTIINGNLNMNNNTISNQLLNMSIYDSNTISNNYNKYTIINTSLSNITLTGVSATNGTYMYLINNSGEDVTLQYNSNNVVLSNNEQQLIFYFNGWILPYHNAIPPVAAVSGKYYFFNGSISNSISYSEIYNYSFVDYILVGGGGGGGGGTDPAGEANYGGGGGGSGLLYSTFAVSPYQLLANNGFKYIIHQTNDIDNTVVLSNYSFTTIDIIIGAGGAGGGGWTNGGNGFPTYFELKNSSNHVVYTSPTAAGGNGGGAGNNNEYGGSGYNGGGGGVGGTNNGPGGSTSQFLYGGSSGGNGTGTSDAGDGGGIGAGIGACCANATSTSAGGGGGAGTGVVFLSGNQTGGNGTLNGEGGQAGGGASYTGAGGGGGSYKGGNWSNGGNGGSGYAILYFHN